MAKKNDWMWPRPTSAWMTYAELVRQMAERGYHETWRNQLHSDVSRMWFYPRKSDTSDRYVVEGHEQCQVLAMIFEPEGQDETGTLMREWLGQEMEAAQ